MSRNCSGDNGKPEPGRSPVTGRNYCYRMNTFFVISGTKMAFLDHFDYELSMPCREIDGEIFISLEDYCKIYSSEGEFDSESHRIEIQRDGVLAVFYLGESVVRCPGAPMELKKAPYEENKTVMIPLTGFNQAVFGERWERDGELIAVGRGEEPLITLEMKRIVQGRKRNKSRGELFRTVWLKEAHKLNPYRLYIPSGYGKEKPQRLLVVLHGATGDSDSMFRSCPDLEYYGEIYNYILLGVNSLVQRGNFGSLLCPQGMFPIDAQKASPGDCDVYSMEEKAENRLAEQGVFKIIDLVKNEYEIPDGNVFVMGNSMGGIGAFHLPAARPGYFRASVPAGAIPELDYIPYGKIGQTPFLLVFGTEDHNWFERAMDSAEVLKQKGMNLRFLPVGGYNHGAAWTRVIKDIFEFFNQFA